MSDRTVASSCPVCACLRRQRSTASCRSFSSCASGCSLEQAEPSNSLVSALVADLALDMRAVWTPDAVFLSGLSRDDLMKAANECGATRKHPGLGKATKKELVATLTSYFKRTADSKATLDESDAKGRAWLPVCMHLAATGTAKPAAAA